MIENKSNITTWTSAFFFCSTVPSCHMQGTNVFAFTSHVKKSTNVMKLDGNFSHARDHLQINLNSLISPFQKRLDCRNWGWCLSYAITVGVFSFKRGADKVGTSWPNVKRKNQKNIKIDLASSRYNLSNNPWPNTHLSPARRAQTKLISRKTTFCFLIFFAQCS